jgi:hypothetical protein
MRLTHEINVRVTQQEKERIQKYAKACSISVSELMREGARALALSGQYVEK